MADNLNISPDMIDNIVDMLKNNGIGKNSTIKENSDKSNSNSDSNVFNSNSSTSSNIDFDMIMKMKSIMDSLNNSNDQDSKLLYSLKPYLRKSRQAKLDQYINILKISQISKMFNKKGDDN